MKDGSRRGLLAGADLCRVARRRVWRRVQLVLKPMGRFLLSTDHYLGDVREVPRQWGIYRTTLLVLVNSDTY